MYESLNVTGFSNSCTRHCKICLKCLLLCVCPILTISVSFSVFFKCNICFFFTQNNQIAYWWEDHHDVFIFFLNWLVLEISWFIWFWHASWITPLFPFFALYSVLFLRNMCFFVLKSISEHVQILRCNGIFYFMHQAFAKSSSNVYYCAYVAYWLFLPRSHSFSNETYAYLY